MEKKTNCLAHTKKTKITEKRRRKKEEILLKNKKILKISRKQI